MPSAKEVSDGLIERVNQIMEEKHGCKTQSRQIAALCQALGELFARQAQMKERE